MSEGWPAVQRQDVKLLRNLMDSNLSTGPRVAYLDTCVPSAIVKGELASSDSQAIGQMGELVRASALTLWTSTVMLEEMNQIPEPYRGPHLEAYNGLKVVTGHPTTNWIDDDPSSPTYGKEAVHPTFQSLRSILPDRNDARHIFQASMNGVRDFVTLDNHTILSRRSQIHEATGIHVWSPSGFVSDVISVGS